MRSSVKGINQSYENEDRVQNDIWKCGTSFQGKLENNLTRRDRVPRS